MTDDTTQAAVKARKPEKPDQGSSGEAEMIAPHADPSAEALIQAPPAETNAAPATTEPQSNLARTRNPAVPKTMEGREMDGSEVKSFGAGYEFDAMSAFKTAAEKATHSLEAVTAATMAAIQGAEQARTYLLSNSRTALENQLAAASAFAKVKSPQEAFDLQAQFARKALDAYRTNVSEMSELFSSSLSATLKPLSATFSSTR